MKRLFAGLLLFLFLLTGCAKEPVPSAEADGTCVASLSAVGDIYLTDVMLADAKTADGSYDFSAQFADTVVALSQADITIGNFEGNFAGTDFGRENGSYPDSLADTLYASGFDLLQTANSYSIYNGISGLERTKSVIENAKMQTVGTYISKKDREDHQVVLREVNGIRIAFIAFTKGIGGMTMPEDTDCSVDLLYKDYTSDYTEMNTEVIAAVLERAKHLEPDFIVASLHWGSENIEEISDSQKEIASFLMENGVDVILGSHSHLIAPVERPVIKTKSGEEKQCVVAYGLGDFCAVDVGGCNTSLILNIQFSKNPETGQKGISKVSYTPVSAIDKGPEFQDRYRVLNSEEALDLYRGNYFDRITDQNYEDITNDLKALCKKVNPE